jgi:hypothetical protein
MVTNDRRLNGPSTNTLVYIYIHIERLDVSGIHACPFD